MDLIGIKPIVQKLLEENEYLRDDDKALIVNVWSEQDPSFVDENKGCRHFFKDFLSGKMAHPDGVTRVRRKLQEHNESLQGVKYKKRKEHAEEVKDQIKEIKKEITE